MTLDANKILYNNNVAEAWTSEVQASQKSKSKSRYDRQSVCQSVLVSSPIWGPTPDFCHSQTVAVFSMRGGASLTRGRVCHLPRSKSVVHVTYIYNFTCRHFTQSVVKSLVPCGHLLFTVLHVTLVYMYVQYTQGLLLV
jgi:hypothetical protein